MDAEARHAVLYEACRRADVARVRLCMQNGANPRGLLAASVFYWRPRRTEGPASDYLRDRARDQVAELLLQSGDALPDEDMGEVMPLWRRGKHPLQLASGVVEAELPRRLGAHVPEIVRLVREFIVLPPHN